MYNPIELVYRVIFQLYKFLSSKSRTLESLWYRLDGEVFNVELIRIEKCSILGLIGITRIFNKTTKEREYLFKYLSYQSIVDMNKLYSLRTMMAYLKENGTFKKLIGNPSTKPVYVTTLLDVYRLDNFIFKETKVEIPIGDKIGILIMIIAYGVNDGKLSVLGIPDDILSMLDSDTIEFKAAIDTYIKHYHGVSYNLLTGNK